jgi:hypothetical protein
MFAVIMDNGGTVVGPFTTRLQAENWSADMHLELDGEGSWITEMNAPSDYQPIEEE